MKDRHGDYSYSLVVIELTGGQLRRPNKPHLLVAQTLRLPHQVLSSVRDGNGPKWIKGQAKTLRPDLIPNYKPTRKKEVADRRLENLKTALARKGFAINGDSKTWRVYVLDVDADVAPPIKNRGKLNKVVYVGQTSTSLETRLRQHQGQLSESGRYIGSRKVKGRNPTLNRRLTPSKVVFTVEDARALETSTHRKLQRQGYRVLGDTIDTDK